MCGWEITSQGLCGFQQIQEFNSFRGTVCKTDAEGVFFPLFFVNQFMLPDLHVSVDDKRQPQVHRATLRKNASVLHFTLRGWIIQVYPQMSLRLKELKKEAVVF